MPHTVITIAQQKGGAGKTTLAAHLAVVLSQRGKRVAVVDIDPQGSLTHWHRIREERFGEGYTGLTFSAVSGWRVGGEISRLRKDHDFIIIDSPPHTEADAKTAIREADLVLLPVQPSPTDLWATAATLKLAKDERKPVKVVLNRVSPNSKLAQLAVDTLGSEDVLDNMLGNRVLFAAALVEGRTANETNPTHAAAQEVKDIVNELLPLLNQEAAEKPVSKPAPKKTAVKKAPAKKPAPKKVLKKAVAK